jgi:hypothetical protein
MEISDTNSYLSYFDGITVPLEFKRLFQELQIYFSFSKSSLIALISIARITDTELVIAFIGFFFNVCKIIGSVLNSGHQTDDVKDMTSSRNALSFVCLILSDDICG